MNRKSIVKPDFNPAFFYGPIVNYEFCGNISKYKGGYRFHLKLIFKSGDTCMKHLGGFKTQSEASKAKELLIADLVRNDFIPFHYTAKEFFDYWLYYYMMDKNKIRYNTFQSYRNILYNHLLPSLGEKKKLKDITIDELVDIIYRIPYPSTKKYACRITMEIFDFAVKEHYLAFNPAIAAVQKIKMRIRQDETTEKNAEKNNRPDIYYSVEQIKMLLYYCKMDFPDMYIPVLLSLTIGTRISETIAIRYYDIDFTSYTVYIDKQLGRDISEEADIDRVITQELAPKTPNAVRSVPLPKWVADELIIKRSWYEAQREKIHCFLDEDYVCCRSDGTPFHRSAFHKDLHKLLRMHGLPDMRWHDLRHVYTTILKNSSVNRKAISEFLGHYSPDFTEEVYVIKEEIAYDCSILETVWEEVKPQGEEPETIPVPFTEDDINGFLEAKNIK